MAAWWLGDQAKTFSARERAYRAYRASGDAVGAARMAQWVASDNLDFRGDFDVAAVWARRGLELLADHGPCAEEGYLTLTQADIALQGASDPETAQGHARHALDLARRSTTSVSRSSRSPFWAAHSSPPATPRRGCATSTSQPPSASVRGSPSPAPPAGLCATRSPRAHASATSSVRRGGAAHSTRGARCGRRGTSSASAEWRMEMCWSPAVNGVPRRTNCTARCRISPPPALLPPR